MGIVKEFREFAMKGSVMDLAVGVIIGAAFGAVVKSLVDDLIMPVVGVLVGGADFSNRYIVLRGDPGGASLTEARATEGVSVLAYGQFINTFLTFLIVAFAVFLMIKTINRMRRRAEGEPPGPMTRQCPECDSAISVRAKRCPQCTSTVPA